MKHLINLSTWFMKESLSPRRRPPIKEEPESEELSGANDIFCIFIANRLKKEIKVQVNEWEIPWRSRSFSIRTKTGTYKIKAITATIRGKRFFVGLWAPSNHQIWACNTAGEKNEWGIVDYKEGAPKYFDMSAILLFYPDQQYVTIEEPYRWFAKNWKNKIITKFTTKKIPSLQEVQLESLVSIIMKDYGMRAVYKGKLGAELFWKRTERICHELKDTIADISGEKKLKETEIQLFDDSYPQRFVFPFCETS